MSAEQNMATIIRLTQTLNDRDMSAIVDSTTPNYTRHDLTQIWGDIRGRAELGDFFS